MKEYAPFLTHQVARFGALTTGQMLTLCQGRCKRSVLYETLSQLMRKRYLVRVSHPTKALIGYSATRETYALVYGRDHQRHTGPRGSELEHSVLCAEVMMELARYSCVTGIATEHEWTPDEIKHFCHERIPDGIIQITQGDLTYELAVEVESSLKGERKTQMVLNQYRQTLQRNMHCLGVVIVAAKPAIFSQYQEQIAELPSDVEERVLLTTVEGLRALNPKYYGTRAEVPGASLESRRISSGGRGNYFLMDSTTYKSAPSI